MNNPFAKLKQRREKKRKLKHLSQMSSVFGTIEHLFKSGLLFWDKRHRHLVIAEPVAMLMLSLGAAQWTNFLNNIYLYVMQKHLADLWEHKLTTLQQKALAKARHTRVSLSKDEIQAIRREVAAEMSENDVPIPEIKSFEFYVVSDSKDANPETTLCGTYNPDTDHLDIVLWEDIRDAVAAYHK